MGSSRSRSPAPIPYGYGSYEQGVDSSGTGAVMPKGMMPENYTPQTQQPFQSSNNIYGAMSNMSQGNQTTGLVNALSKGSSYSPFFMRF